jgi:hypothetical protein
MKRNMISMILLSLVTLGLGLGTGPGSVARAASPEEAKTDQKAQKLREKALEIPPQTMVEVRLKNKEVVKGRLGDVSSDSFVVKEAIGQRIEDHKIAFDDVKSMKKFEGNKALKVAGYSALAVAVAIGTAMVISLIVVLATT